MTSINNSIYCDFLSDSVSINFESIKQANSKRYGMEIELLVLDSNFKETNDAEKLIQLAHDSGLQVERECSQSMVELISRPGSGNDIVCQLAEDYKTLSLLAKTIGLYILPIDYPLNSSFLPEIRPTKKYLVQQEIIGDSFIFAGSVCGIHVHFDVLGNSLDSQRVNLLKLLDPLIVSICSLMKHKVDDVEIQNWRMYVYRKLVYKDFKHNGGLAPLTPSFVDFVEQMSVLTESFKQKYTGNEDINQFVLPYKGVWGSLRLKPEIPTIELRSAGSVPDFVFIKYLMDFLERFDELISQENDSLLHLNTILQALFKTSDIADASQQLEQITDLAIIEGLSNQNVQTYIDAFVNLFDDITLKNLFTRLLYRKEQRDAYLQNNISISETYRLLHTFCMDSIDCILSEKLVDEKLMTIIR